MQRNKRDFQLEEMSWAKKLDLLLLHFAIQKEISNGK